VSSSKNAKNLLTFALLLAVPAAMTGCNSIADNQAECDDDLDPYCEDDDDYDGSSKIFKSSSKSKSKSVFSGFGSSGKGSSGG
jgi:hypothetical protein